MERSQINVDTAGIVRILKTMNTTTKYSSYEEALQASIAEGFGRDGVRGNGQRGKRARYIVQRPMSVAEYFSGGSSRIAHAPEASDCGSPDAYDR